MPRKARQSKFEQSVPLMNLSTSLLRVPMHHELSNADNEALFNATQVLGRLAMEARKADKARQAEGQFE